LAEDYHNSMQKSYELHSPPTFDDHTGDLTKNYYEFLRTNDGSENLDLRLKPYRDLDIKL